MVAPCYVLVACTIVLVSLASRTLASVKQQEPPKVIVFQLGDDYGFNNVEYPHGPNNAGNPESRTPTMAKLAVEEGIRLERHYVYKYCSPTRSAFLSGRLPVHVNQNNNCNDASSMSGIDLRMTLLPQKLKQAGYRTAAVGKWHCGARSAANLPVNRGFDYHLGFLKGGEDHFQQNHCAGGPDATTIDLWQLESPAFGRNGVYSAFLYAKAAVQVVANFSAEVRDQDPSAKLFLYLPWHNTHTPLEAPDEYLYPPYPGYNNNFSARMTYNAMSRALDDGMANVTNAIRNAGFWNSTLVVFSADNGGWLLPGGRAGSSNFPYVI
jgi:arylsulfatase A-like enzyme